MEAKISSITDYKRRSTGVEVCKIEFKPMRNDANHIIIPDAKWMLKEDVEELKVEVGDVVELQGVVGRVN